MKLLSTALIALAAVFSAFSPGITMAQELVLSIGSRGYGQAVDPAIESFQAANPGVKVEWLKISDVPNESRKLYVTSFLAKSPTPDVFAVDIIWPGEFAKRGWIAPLSDSFEAKDAAQYNSAFIEAATVDGKVYGVPLFVGGTMFFYRKDLLDKYGLKRSRHLGAGHSFSQNRSGRRKRSATYRIRIHVGENRRAFYELAVIRLRQWWQLL